MDVFHIHGGKKVIEYLSELGKRQAPPWEMTANEEWQLSRVENYPWNTQSTPGLWRKHCTCSWTGCVVWWESYMKEDLQKSHRCLKAHHKTHLIKNKVLKRNITKQQQKADQKFLYCVGRIEWYLCSLHVGGWPYSHIVTNLISSEGTKGKSSLTGCMQRGQYICPGTNHILIQATQ